MWTIRIPPDGPATLVQTGGSLQELQALVGGDIEPIYGDGPVGHWVALVDEDGVNKLLALNYTATNIARACGCDSPWILHGPVLFLDHRDDGEFTSISALMRAAIDLTLGPIQETPCQTP